MHNTDTEVEQMHRIADLERMVQKKDSENANLQSKLDDTLQRFKEVKLMAERRARMLHHVMEEYNGMTKEYELIKSESCSMQSRMTGLQDKITTLESQVECLEHNIQFLELENNELRRVKVIDAPTNVSYGECSHICSRHPRSFARMSAKKLAEMEEQEAIPCETCTEAEQWAEDLIKNPPAFTDSLRRHFDSTLPLRTPLTTKYGQDSQFSTFQKPTLKETEDSSRKVRTTIGTDRF